MKLPIICFNQDDLKKVEEKIFRNPYKAVSITLKEVEGLRFIENIKEIGDFTPRFQCFPILPEECSNCRKAESTVCSRWWLGDWADDRPEPSEDLDYSERWANEWNEWTDNRPESPLEYQNGEFYFKVWSKKKPVSRTLAMIGSISRDEHTFRTALVLTQLGVEDPEWAKRLWESDLPWDPNFLPEVVEIPQRREIKIFKKVLNKVIRDTKQIDPKVREVWLAFVAGHLAKKWGLSQDILESWLGKILTKL
jgi:hypothetical protein